VSRVFNTHRGETVTALGASSASVKAGEFIALVGPSGCGKTTLLKIIGGLMPPSAGTVVYKGEPVTGPVEDLGIVFQQPILLDWRTVQSNITLQLSMRRLLDPAEQAERARALLERVGLSGYEDRYPWELSGGQQQRVSLCRALVHQPGLLLMDEPFGALDAMTREQLQADLEELWIAARPIVVFVTHDVGEAVSLADRVLVFSGKPGRIVEDIRIDVPRPRAASLLENSKLQNYAKQVRALLGSGNVPPKAVASSSTTSNTARVQS
jgi:NitT/TauT family transport system ATP-binding protein